MDIGLFFFADSGGAGGDGYRLLLDSARFADANGFCAVWTPERHFHPFGGLYPNPAVTGAAVAAVTERVGIRAGSVVAPLHHPVRIAEEWSVVDNLSNGRVAVSFASGWHAVDFVLRPENYQDRRGAMLEAVTTVRRLWRGEEVEFPDDDAGRSTRCGSSRRRCSRNCPSGSPAPARRRRSGPPGASAAGVLTHLLGQDADVLARNIAIYRTELAEAHDGAVPGRVALMLHTLIGTDRDQVREQVRGPFSDYLRSSMDLVKAASGLLPPGLDVNQLPERDKEFLVAHAFERYFSTSGLFGTVADGVQTADRLRAIGVDELACLIDYGVPADEVLRSLDHLADLGRQIA